MGTTSSHWAFLLARCTCNPCRGAGEEGTRLCFLFTYPTLIHLVWGVKNSLFLQVGMNTSLALFSTTSPHSAKASKVTKAALQCCPAPPQLLTTMAQQRQQTALHVETSSIVKSVVTASNCLFTASNFDSCNVFSYDACSLNINLQNAMAHLLICM